MEIHVCVRVNRITSHAAGPDTKKKRSSAGKGAASKQRDSHAAGEGLVQTTVEDMAATNASASDAKLVDPNTGKEVKVHPADSDKPASSKPTKGKGRKAGQLVDPNTGEKVEASSVVKSDPAAKPSSSKQVKKEQSSNDKAGASTSDKDQPVQINRAPVLTLWVAVVAERQGFSREAGLTFGKAISGMLAQSKGRCDSILLLCCCRSNHVELQQRLSLNQRIKVLGNFRLCVSLLSGNFQHCSLHISCVHTSHCCYTVTGNNLW